MAITDFSGSITNTPDFSSFLFGEAVLPLIAEQLRAADADPEVKAHVLRIDSPGGPPAGLEEFNEVLRSLTKPIIGFSDGMIASGAMWVASALDGIVATRTASVGSIGVIAVIMEFTKMLEQDGVKATVLRAGKLKAIGNRFEVLTDEGEATIQAEMDHLHEVFIETVATGLDVSVEEIRKVADGRMFIGQQAVDAGLVDKIGLLNDAIEMALDNNTNGGTTMSAKLLSVKELRTEYPEFCAEIEKEAQAAVKLPDVPLAVSEETTRVTALASAHFGEEIGKKFKALVEMGVTVDQYTSMRALNPAPVAPKADAAKEAKAAELKTAYLAKLKALETADPGTGAAVTDGPKTFMEAIDVVKAANPKLDTQAAMAKTAKDYPALYAEHAKGGAK